MLWLAVVPPRFVLVPGFELCPPFGPVWLLDGFELSLEQANISTIPASALTTPGFLLDIALGIRVSAAEITIPAILRQISLSSAGKRAARPHGRTCPPGNHVGSTPKWRASIAPASAPAIASL
jgi:hypothetical protein